jgi:hypothetical protein
MVPTNLGHKRSATRVVLPFPTANNDESRYSNDSLAPRNGYNGLVSITQPFRFLFQLTMIQFTTGLLPHMDPSPTLSSFPSPPRTSIRGPFHPSPEKQTTSPNNSPAADCSTASHVSPSRSKTSPMKTPTRRRGSSLIHSNTASPRLNKSAGLDNGVERALDSVMRSLKLVAMGTPRPRHSTELEQSRWSSSSEESITTHTEETDNDGFWRPRKSGESNRSKITMKSVATGRSKASSKTKKSRKSEDTDRMEIDACEDIPPVPATVPLTPGRSRRMMDGLVKRLGLTPRKNKASKGYVAFFLY